jgi:hypothetical protein
VRVGIGPHLKGRGMECAFIIRSVRSKLLVTGALSGGRLIVRTSECT